MRGLINKGRTELQPVNAAGKIADVGFAFFLMFVAALYTANLVSVLMQPPSVDITSIEQLVANRYPVCVIKNKLPVAVRAVRVH